MDVGERVYRFSVDLTKPGTLEARSPTDDPSCRSALGDITQNEATIDRLELQSRCWVLLSKS